MADKQKPIGQIIDALANIIYTEENINRANEYLWTRGINPDKLAFPWSLTDDNPRYYGRFKAYYPVTVFVETLYVPIPNPIDQTSLQGFDMRYNGEQLKSFRTRWMKLKRDYTQPLIYNLHEALYSKEDRPILVVESAMDAESLRQLNLPVIVISPLTSLQSTNFLAFLLSLSERVIFCYDNDKTGQTAVNVIKRDLEDVGEFAKNFAFMQVRGKDPNDSLLSFGRDYLKSAIELQISQFS